MSANVLSFECDNTTNIGAISGQVLVCKNAEFTNKQNELVRRAELRLGAGSGIGALRVYGETGEFDAYKVGDTVVVVFHLEPGWKAELGPQMVAEPGGVRLLSRAKKAAFTFGGDLASTPKPQAATGPSR